MFLSWFCFPYSNSLVCVNFFFTGMIPPKPLIRRDQMEGSPNSSETFEHIARSARDHGISLSEPRMMWGSDPYHAEPQQAATPKSAEEPGDAR